MSTKGLDQPSSEGIPHLLECTKYKRCITSLIQHVGFCILIVNNKKYLLIGDIVLTRVNSVNMKTSFSFFLEEGGWTLRMQMLNWA